MIQLSTFHGGDSHPKQACNNAMNAANDFLARHAIKQIISQTTNFSSLLSEGGYHWNDCIITIVLDIPFALKMTKEEEETDPKRDETPGDLDERLF